MYMDNHTIITLSMKQPPIPES